MDDNLFNAAARRLSRDFIDIFGIDRSKIGFQSAQDKLARIIYGYRDYHELKQNKDKISSIVNAQNLQFNNAEHTGDETFILAITGNVDFLISSLQSTMCEYGKTKNMIVRTFQKNLHYYDFQKVYTVGKAVLSGSISKKLAEDKNIWNSAAPKLTQNFKNAKKTDFLAAPTCKKSVLIIENETLIPKAIALGYRFVIVNSPTVKSVDRYDVVLKFANSTWKTLKSTSGKSDHFHEQYGTVEDIVHAACRITEDLTKSNFINRIQVTSIYKKELHVVSFNPVDSYNIEHSNDVHLDYDGYISLMQGLRKIYNSKAAYRTKGKEHTFNYQDMEYQVFEYDASWWLRILKNVDGGKLILTKIVFDRFVVKEILDANTFFEKRRTEVVAEEKPKEALQYPDNQTLDIVIKNNMHKKDYKIPPMVKTRKIEFPTA